jgi:hypothetical protein
MRAAILLLAFACAAAEAQTPAKPVKPVAPSVSKATPAKPPIVARARAADLPALKISLAQAEAQQAALEKKKDETGELSAEDATTLQKTMEKKGQLESIISAVMSAVSE